MTNLKFSEPVLDKSYGNKTISISDSDSGIPLGILRRPRVGIWVYYPGNGIFIDIAEMAQILAKLKELNG
jgi:hypothetical protein